MSHNDEQQRTDQWFSDRLGHVSASEISKVMAKGAGKTRKTYMRKLACEIITGERGSGIRVTGAMQKGIDREPLAIAQLGFVKDIEIKECGFIKHLDIVGVGASPDGLILKDGGCEVKCPNRETHLEYLIAGKVPSIYKGQVQCQMWCTNREWWYFMSYHPLMKPLICRVVVDWEYRERMIEAVAVFLEELKTMVEKFKQ